MNRRRALVIFFLIAISVVLFNSVNCAPNSVLTPYGEDISGIINVKAYGAIGDGKTNDYVAIMKAIIEFRADGYNKILYFPPAKGYVTDSTLKIVHANNIVMDAPIIFTGDNDKPAIEIGNESLQITNARMKINVTNHNQSNWDNDSNVGVIIHNAYQSHIDLVQVKGFTIGLQVIGAHKGFAYNKIELGLILNNKIGVDLTNVNKGWCNENLFLGGRFANFKGPNNGKSRYGVRITSQDGLYVKNNNNVFIKPSFELVLKNAVPGEAIPILIEHGNINKFDSIRDEGNSKYVARVLNSSRFNVFDIGYGIKSKVDDRSLTKSSKLHIRRQNDVTIE